MGGGLAPWFPPAWSLVDCNREGGRKQELPERADSHDTLLRMQRLWPHVPSVGPLSVMPSSVYSTCLAITTSTFQSRLGLQQGVFILPIATILPCSRDV